MNPFFKNNPTPRNSLRTFARSWSRGLCLALVGLGSVLSGCVAGDGSVLDDGEMVAERDDPFAVTTVVLQRVHVMALADGTTPDATPTWLWDGGPDASGRYKVKLDGGPEIQVSRPEYTPSAPLSRNADHSLEVWGQSASGSWTFLGAKSVTVTSACSMTSSLMDSVALDEQSYLEVSLCAEPANATTLAGRIGVASSALSAAGEVRRDERLAWILADVFQQRPIYYTGFQLSTEGRLAVESQTGVIVDALRSRLVNLVSSSNGAIAEGDVHLARALMHSEAWFARGRYTGTTTVFGRNTSRANAVVFDLTVLMNGAEGENALATTALRTSALRGLEILGTTNANDAIDRCAAQTEAGECGAGDMRDPLKFVLARRGKSTIPADELPWFAPTMMSRRYTLHFDGVQFHLFIPKDPAGGKHTTYDLLVSVHGTGGDGARYMGNVLNANKAQLDNRGTIVIAPTFDWAAFPRYDRLQVGPGLARSDRWLLAAIDYVADFVSSADPSRHLEKDTFRLFGHSKGGQFVNHFAPAHSWRLERSVAAGSGMYAADGSLVTAFAPDLAADSAGTWNFGRLVGRQYAVVIGDADTANGEDVPDRRIREAWKYLCTDIYRYCNFVPGVTQALCTNEVWSAPAQIPSAIDGHMVDNPAAAAQPSQTLAPKCGVEYISVPGGGHSGATNYAAATAFLFD